MAKTPMTRLTTATIGSILRATAVALACAPMLAAGSVVSVRILDVDGRWTGATLRSVDERAWHIADGPNSAERTIATDRVIAFLAQRPLAPTNPDATVSLEAPSPISYGMLETQNGQLLPGTLRAGIDAMTWEHRWIGAIPLAIDNAATIRFRASRTLERRADGDAILFANGDIATGFVEKIGSDVLFEPLDAAAALGEDDGAAGAAKPADLKPTDKPPAEQPKTRRIPIERIAAIAFARADATPALDGARMWTIDGSVVGGRDLRYDASAGWSFALADPLLLKVRATRTTDNLAADPLAGVLDPSRMVPLAKLGAPKLSVPEGLFHYGSSTASRVGTPARALLGLAEVELAGPIVARFEIPDALRPAGDELVFSTDLVLAEPAPTDARVEVQIAFGKTRSERVLLDAEHRRVSIAVRASAADAKSIELTVTDGGNGIIGDRVQLERACIIGARR